ncbi:MAG TPA: signal peptidase I [Pseudomonadales bacterium]|nr:signal peptidase I [Pseudomonadales bacterium]
MADATDTGNPQRKPDWLQIIAIGRNPQYTLARIIVLVALCVFLFHYVLLAVKVDGISMQPTYKNRSVNLVNRWAYLWHEPRRGDVVAIRLAGVHLMYMKRIIGLPGETVAFSDGTVLINGQPLAEPYEKWHCDWTLPPKKLDMDEYFIVGDNRTMPSQNHTFGVVERFRIVGKVLL